jgi:hypothetical protein
LKAVLIVLGSVAALAVVVAVGLFVFFVVHAFGSLSSNSQADLARTASKIADFTLPPGYRYGSAVDMILLDNVIIEPVSRRGDFVIALQGVSMSDSSPANVAETLKTVRAGTDPDHTCVEATEPTEHVTTAGGKTVVLETMHCTHDGKPRTVEFAQIPSKLPLALLVATGSPRFFDGNAVRALAQSIR